MGPRAESYLRRTADDQLLDALLAGEFVYVLDSRQKGKSSLVVRAITELRARGVRTVRLDLQRVGANVTVEQWYAGLLAGVGDELGLSAELHAYWSDHAHLGALARWLGAWRDVVLASNDEPVVVFVDEVDFVRSLSFPTDEFFAGVRDCYNRRADDERYQALTFCLVGVATPSQLIQNPDITPFNIGRRLELADFTLDETMVYSAELDRIGLPGPEIVTRVYHWVRGHPYLTQLVCSRVAAEPDGNAGLVDRLVNETFLTPEARHREPNLADVERRLLEPDLESKAPEEQRTRILEVYARVLRGKVVSGDDENPLIATLRLSGACAEQGGRIVVRNPLYAAAFDEQWRRSSLPDAELRRQRAATLRGALFTGGIAAVVVATIGWLAWRNAGLAFERARLLEQSRQLANVAEQRAYTAQMGSLAGQERSGRGLRLARLLEQSSKYAGKGWEWHRWNLILNGQERSLQTGRPGTYWLTISGSLSGFTNELAGGNSIWVVQDKGVSEKVKSAPAYTWLARLALDSKDAMAWHRRLESLVAKLPEAAIAQACTREATAVLYYDQEDRAFHLRKEDGTDLELLADPTKPNTLIGAFTIDGDRLALQTSDNTIYCFDARTAQRLWSLPGFSGLEMEFSPDGNWLALATADERVLLYRTRGDVRRFELTGHSAPARTARFSPDGTHLVTASQDGTARIWNVQDRSTVRTLAGHREYLLGAVYTPDGRKILTSDAGGEVREWNVAPRNPTETAVTLAGEVHRVVEADGQSWLASSNQGALVAFDVASGSVVAQLPAGTLDGDPPIVVSPNGRFVATGFGDKTLRVLDSASLRVVDRWAASPASVTAIAYSKRGDQLTAGFYDGSVRLMTHGDPDVHVWRAHTKRVRDVEFSADGSQIVTSSDDATVAVWNRTTRALQHRWSAPNTITSIEFSANGAHLLGACYDGSVFLLDTRTWKATRLRGHTSRVFRAIYSPDQTRILSYGWDGTARLWDARTGRALATMTHDSWVSSAKFSPDGKRVVSASADKTMRVWDGWTGDEYFILQGHREVVFEAQFSRDGATIVSASNDGTVRIWRSR